MNFWRAIYWSPRSIVVGLFIERFPLCCVFHFCFDYFIDKKSMKARGIDDRCCVPCFYHKTRIVNTCH